MSPGSDAIIGINWGSSNFRAYLIGDDGSCRKEFSEPAGVVGMDRAAMAAQVQALRARWPDARAIYASGMIGSNVGWIEVPYANAPADGADLAEAAVLADIGDVPVFIVPGVTCRRPFDGQPDVMRGEEIELLGATHLRQIAGLAILPGTHTKWVQVEDSRVGTFFTSMSGEIFDRLTNQGLLASIVEGEARDGDAFRHGVETGANAQMSLATALFGARALVVRGEMQKADAASYLRGLLIGAEIGDARRAYPDFAGPVPLIGNAPLGELYRAALAMFEIDGLPLDARDACVAGFVALDAARRG